MAEEDGVRPTFSWVNTSRPRRGSSEDVCWGGGVRKITERPGLRPRTTTGKGVWAEGRSYWSGGGDERSSRPEAPAQNAPSRNSPNCSSQVRRRRIRACSRRMMRSKSGQTRHPALSVQLAQLNTSGYRTAVKKVKRHSTPNEYMACISKSTLL